MTAVAGGVLEVGRDRRRPSGRSDLTGGPRGDKPRPASADVGAKEDFGGFRNEHSLLGAGRRTARFRRNEVVFGNADPSDQVFAVVSGGAVRTCRNLQDGRRRLPPTTFPAIFLDSASLDPASPSRTRSSPRPSMMLSSCCWSGGCCGFMPKETAISGKRFLRQQRASFVAPRNMPCW